MLTPQAWAVERLGHRFEDPARLEAAITHRSVGRTNYERLEFLGDAVLTLVVATLVYRRFPDADEGALSRYRAALVSEASLAEVATEIGLGAQLRLGGGELKSGGQRRGSILSDALEGVIGAVFEDGGFDAARGVVERLLAGRLDRLPDAGELKDPKTRLQEYMQARGLALPVYTVENVSGEPHEQWFVVTCEIAAMQTLMRGEGPSRRRAEQEAALRVLGTLPREGRA